MPTMTRITSTHTLPRAAVWGAEWVGQIVTDGDAQYVVYSVEGYDWYAFDQDGQTTIDCNMTPQGTYRDPMLTLLPMGTAIGQGFGRNAHMSKVRRAVCLAKW